MARSIRVTKPFDTWSTQARHLDLHRRLVRGDLPPRRPRPPPAPDRASRVVQVARAHGPPPCRMAPGRRGAASVRLPDRGRVPGPGGIQGGLPRVPRRAADHRGGTGLAGPGLRVHAERQRAAIPGEVPGLPGRPSTQAVRPCLSGECHLGVPDTSLACMGGLPFLAVFRTACAPR